MWSFDDEENKQGTEGGEGSAPEPENNDDFDTRDPFSRGGDFYTSYNGAGSGGEERQPKKPKKSLGSLFPAILVCAAVFLSTLAIGSFLGPGNNAGSGNMGNTTPPTQGNTGTTGTRATAPALTTGTASVVPPLSYVQWEPEVVQSCLNSCVLITVEGVGSGSGVIYTQDGYILTNHHVVSNGEKPITVTLFSGEKIPATYIYSDEANDVSVIKIEKSDCVYASISTEEVSYMMPVMVIGNALGRGFSTTQGVVSAPASEVYFSSTYETMTLIRVDAAINNGNSGGGLFNTAGQLIGIVNAKTSGTTSSGATIESMGYAIPMSTVMRCVNDLRDYGYVTGEARLGVNINNYISVGGKKYLATGMMIVSYVVPGGSAQVSGIKQNDILYKLNGERVESLKTLHSILTRYSVGDEVQITVLRPNSEAMKQTDPHEYLRKCDEITLTVKFTEFDPNK